MLKIKKYGPYQELNMIKMDIFSFFQDLQNLLYMKIKNVNFEK